MTLSLPKCMSIITSSRLPAARPRIRQGSSLIQVLVVIAIIALLIGIFVPVAAKLRAASRSTECLAHLRGIATAFRLYAAENGDLLPNPAFTQIPWEHSLSRYASFGTFICPADQELAAATLSSYDWRDTGVESTTIAGRSLYIGRSDAVLAFDALPGWHAKNRMSVVRMDGSALAVSTDECVSDLSKPLQKP